MQTNEELREYFPQMKPLEKPPGLFTLNGIGMGMYGKRDVHPDTGAYIKTRCICFVFIPLIALGSYRVMDAPGGGWYFLGEEPLSPFAKRCNMILLLSLFLLGGGGGYLGVINSPNYKAGQLLEQAKQASQRGQLHKALTQYEKAAQISANRSAEARRGVTALITQRLPKAPPKEIKRVFAYFGAQMPAQLKRQQPGLFASGKTLAARYHDKDLMLSLAIYDVLRKLAPNVTGTKAIYARQAKLLERAIKRAPKDIKLAIKLAQVYEVTERCLRCVKLLSPHEKTLLQRNDEGTRILGEMYGRLRRLEPADKLLSQYVPKRLHRFSDAEKAYYDVVRQVRQGAINDLRKRRGPKSFYRRSFKRLPKAERNRRIIMYIQRRLQKSKRVARKRYQLRQTTRVVPVAMSLGIIKLQKARSTRHPASRQSLLKQAERLFLAIQKMASRSDQYKMHLGQVYYWLGKQEKGQKLFDQLLKQRKRAPGVLIRLARILREVGDRDKARQMAQEAYSKAKKPKHKNSAASLRALTSDGIDDKIRWLKRAEKSVPSIAALLNSTLGDRAMQKAKPKEAAAYYRKAIKAYKAMHTNPSTLNNSALAYFSLFQATGERSAFDMGIKQIQSAVALRPSDSILLFNAADAMMRAALLDVVRRSFSPAQLKLQLQTGLLTYLYTNEATRAPIAKRLAAHPALKKARSLYSKVLLLAPNNAYAYQSLAQLNNALRDARGMKELAAQLKRARVSVAGTNAQTRAIYTGLRDVQFQESFKRELKRRAKMKELLTAQGKRKAAGIVAARMAYTGIAYAMFGGRISYQHILTLAQKAYENAPSSHSRQGLINALLFRGLQNIVKKMPEAKERWKFSRRALTTLGIVAALMHDQNNLREQLRNNPYIKRAAALQKQHIQVLPKRIPPSVWAFLRWFYPALTKRMADAIKGDDTATYYRQIKAALHPVRPSYALQLYFATLAKGALEKAKTHRARFAKHGIPLPFSEFLPQQVKEVR